MSVFRGPALLLVDAESDLASNLEAVRSSLATAARFLRGLVNNEGITSLPEAFGPILTEFVAMTSDPVICNLPAVAGVPTAAPTLLE